MHTGQVIVEELPRNDSARFVRFLARAVLRHGDFSSRADLLEKVTDFAIVHNETARPFHWTYEARPRQTGHENAAAAKEPRHAR
ncbi:hypothetical protein [Streptomyces sp. NPDC007100]|uniref:hypothetical protein n=1 Tax=Streptomyces sp. NPDC007100 TaxID=3155602 RepID=UPI0033C106FB